LADTGACRNLGLPERSVVSTISEVRRFLRRHDFVLDFAKAYVLKYAVQKDTQKLAATESLKSTSAFK